MEEILKQKKNELDSLKKNIAELETKYELTRND